ncbi:MAG: M48 family metalloprotease [candidate division WOR-3 bacterium]
MRETLYSLISKNKLRTALFIIGFSLILAIVGYALTNIFHWGTSGYVLFGLFIIFYNLILYYNSDKLALAISGAKPADPEEYHRLHNVVEELSIAAGIPKPKVYIINDPAPNAFATGRNPRHASVAVTAGLLDMMNREELQGVIAHEFSHIKNYDILLMTIVAIIGGLLILFRDLFLRSMFFMPRRRDSRRSGGGIEGILVLAGIALAIVAPILVVLIRAAISREREYLADASGAYLTRHPDGLADALEKIGRYTGKLRTASDATAHLFISNPFGKDKMSVANLFATHPPIQARIARLRQLEI